MKGILIDKAEIEKLQKEYKKLAEQNCNINKDDEKKSDLKFDSVLEESEL